MRKANVSISSHWFSPETVVVCAREHACLYFGRVLSTFSFIVVVVVEYCIVFMLIRISNLMPRCAANATWTCCRLIRVIRFTICQRTKYIMRLSNTQPVVNREHNDSLRTMRRCLCNSLPISMAVTQSYLICKWHLICTNVIEFLCYHILKFA